MTMQRRDFLMGTAIVVSEPALGLFASLASSGQQARVLPEALQPQVAVTGGKSNGAVMKIHGWEINDSNDDDVFVSVNQSWRANWR